MLVYPDSAAGDVPQLLPVRVTILGIEKAINHDNNGVIFPLFRKGLRPLERGG